MVRISKQSERRNKSPRKHRCSIEQPTGAKQDNLSEGFKVHANALEGELAKSAFIPKIK